MFPAAELQLPSDRSATCSSALAGEATASGTDADLLIWFVIKGEGEIQLRCTYQQKHRKHPSLINLSRFHCSLEEVLPSRKV